MCVAQQSPFKSEGLWLLYGEMKGAASSGDPVKGLLRRPQQSKWLRSSHFQGAKPRRHLSAAYRRRRQDTVSAFGGNGVGFAPLKVGGTPTLTLSGSKCNPFMGLRAVTDPVRNNVRSLLCGTFCAIAIGYGTPCGGCGQSLHRP